MSNKEYKIEVIDAPTNEVIEKDTGGESWWYKNIGTPINESDRQIAKEKASIKEEEYKKFMLHFLIFSVYSQSQHSIFCMFHP